jgi:hypothetical protein
LVLGDRRYLLQEPIGSGGVAHVFKALHYRVRRQVAVKLLHQTTLGEHSLAPRFEHEALALAQLSHPNIVRLQDYGVTSVVKLPGRFRGFYAGRVHGNGAEVAPVLILLLQVPHNERVQARLPFPRTTKFSTEM